MKEKTSVKLTFSLLQLQNLIKRDPLSYYEEFQQQYEHFKAQLKLFKFDPQEFHENFADLVSFLAQVSSCYEKDLKDFPVELMSILREYATVLQPNMRHCLVKALILMRNRGVLSPTDLTTLFFELLRCQDKLLRDMVQVHIVSDLKKINAVHKNQKVNTVLQNFMFKMLADDNKSAPRVSLDIMIDLYRRNIWRDEKTVNAIATACFSKDNKLLVKAIHFFLNIDEKDEDEEEKSDSENDTPTLREVVQAHKVNKKTRKRKKVLEKAKQLLKKSKKRKKNHETVNFAAIHLLHDPLGLAEKLFARLQKMTESFEVKLLVMNFISRLIGIHELLVLNFYPFLRKFIKPRQTDVTKILMCAAQAVHEYVPPDSVQELVKEILYNFVTERNSSEVITVGINSIREICARCPLAIGQDLLHDLAQYEKYKDKNVTMAAKSLIKLFREINPKMLQRRFRSRPTEATKQIDSKKFEYGALSAKSYIPGTENLSLDPSAENNDVKAEDDEANDSDGSWIDVSHSEDEIPDEEDDESEDEECEEEDENDDDEEENLGTTDELVENGVNKSKTDVVDKNKTGKKAKTKTSENVEDEKIKAETISHSRILSQEEFQKIKAIQIANQVQYAKGKKRKAESMTEEPGLKKTEVVSLKDIERLHKRPKADKETRLETIMEGREGREKFGKKKEKNPHASKTKKEQKRNKAFMMIKHKVRSKVKRSFRDKQLALRNALLKRKKKH
ncbi:Protein SDA1 [Araneus ventricosus]|uniref:Protein SDA1 n=1 Tax=Araneus ventricosus TaxID=182803 RepID=A0A4Y2CKY8_ARAVE|nr:Protein SDA1 [Araneus ventricosus]